MIALGLILLLLGIFFHIHVVFVLGIAALIIGGCLVIAGALGHSVGGRQYWY